MATRAVGDSAGPPLVALSACAALLVVLVTFETLRWADARDRIRHQGEFFPQAR